MKVAFTGLDLPEGKVKYRDPIVEALTEKFSPKKVSPYFFEFLRDAYEDADGIVVAEDRVLDLLILDMEKIESRLSRVESEGERSALEQGLHHLEQGHPLCDGAFDAATLDVLKALGLPSLKPTLVVQGAAPASDDVCRSILEKSGHMFFYTAGPQEVHAWFVDGGVDAVTCAGKIHTDLARGFIKAEIIGFDELMTAHSFQDARTKGLTRLVDRDFPIPARTVLEIRFNVSKT